MGTSLTRLFGRAVLNPFGCTVVVALLLSLTHVQEKGFESGFIVSDGFKEAIFSVVIFSVLLSFLSLGIFLNQYKRICSSYLLSCISWLALPSGMILFSVVDQVTYLVNYGGGSETNFLLECFFFFVCICHSGFLVTTFLQFRQSLPGQPRSGDFSQMSAG